jgi:outer membrane protein, heavy metal efflux system
VRWIALLALAGCVSRSAGYDDVRSLVRERSGAEVRWDAVDDGELSEDSAALLRAPLTEKSAVAIALLENRQLQADFEDLGVAGADLQRALGLPNPHVQTGVHFLSGRDAQFDIEVMLSLSHFFYMPLREKAASAELEASVLEMSGKALDLVLAVRRAFREHQAAAEVLELRKRAAAASRAAAEAARELHGAGNFTDLEAATQQALYEESRLAVGRAELRAALTRESLSEVMGLWGKGARWKLEARLLEPAEDDPSPRDLERRALARSIDLRIALRRHEAASSRADLAIAEGWIPSLGAGVEVEREDEGWEIGPEFELEVPLFYQGQGESRAAEADMRRQKARHAALAVGVRAAAREAGARLAGARGQAKFYRDVLLPLRERIVHETTLENNAMAASVFELLQAKRTEIETRSAYVEALRDYWLARADVEQLLAGRLVRRAAMGEADSPAPSSGQSAGH